ncbi:hypothetical protein [Actinokineospora sp. HUAS TT18]|uniref:hypothetical protein n=1 Tax=Actinokineospora sp. HUAS TT18 TaxID=3447451 RepID=UPI003F51BA0C
MKSPVHQVLGRTSRGWVLPAVIGAAVVMTILIGGRWVPFGTVYIEDLARTKILDVRWTGYGSAEGAQVLHDLGEAGRRHYDYFQLADVGYLLIYGLALASAVYAGFGRGRLAAGLAMVPVGTAVFDALEDTLVFVALRTYPDPSRAALAVAGVVVVVKVLGFVASAGLAAAGGVVALIRRRRVGNGGEQ